MSTSFTYESICFQLIKVLDLLQQFLWSYIFGTLLSPEELDSLVSLIFSVSSTLFYSTSKEFLEIWREKFDGSVLCKTDCSKACHTLHIASMWVSVLSFVARENISGDRWLKTWISVYRKMSLEVILLLPLFSRTIEIFGNNGLPSLRVLATQVVSVTETIMWSGPWRNADIGWLWPQLLCHFYTTVSYRQTITVDQWISSWFGFLTFLCWHHVE